MRSTRNGVRIRTATPADAAAIADVHTASIRELGGEAYDDRQVRAWAAKADPDRYPLGDAGVRIVVAEREVDGQLVGFGLLDREPGDGTIGRIGAVYVHPDHAREGIGRAILEHLEAAARDAGLERIALTASKNAIEFYRRHGYEGVETVALEMQDGVVLECLRMRKRLAPTPCRLDCVRWLRARLERLRESHDSTEAQALLRIVEAKRPLNGGGQAPTRCSPGANERSVNGLRRT